MLGTSSWSGPSLCGLGLILDPICQGSLKALFLPLCISRGATHEPRWVRTLRQREQELSVERHGMAATVRAGATGAGVGNISVSGRGDKVGFVPVTARSKLVASVGMGKVCSRSCAFEQTAWQQRETWINLSILIRAPFLKQAHIIDESHIVARATEPAMMGNPDDGHIDLGDRSYITASKLTPRRAGSRGLTLASTPQRTASRTVAIWWVGTLIVRPIRDYERTR